MIGKGERGMAEEEASNPHHYIAYGLDFLSSYPKMLL
jgi:hypothetical protein